jgi:hypothetical protein
MAMAVGGTPRRGRYPRLPDSSGLIAITTGLPSGDKEVVRRPGHEVHPDPIKPAIRDVMGRREPR